MRNTWREFKEFAFKGNLIDLAVAVVIGGAFGAVVNSLVKNIIMPIVSYVLPSDQSYRTWKIGSAAKPILVGEFIGDVLNFLIVALAVFLAIVKVVGLIVKKPAAPVASAEPVTKECPLCLSVIPIKAVKCGHCTGDLK